MQEDTRIDTLLANQKEMLKNQELILSEVAYIDPLEGKKYGVEFNPASFLLSTISDEGFILTGSFSFFLFQNLLKLFFQCILRKEMKI